MCTIVCFFCVRIMLGKYERPFGPCVSLFNSRLQAGRIVEYFCIHVKG
jgi:hypothetical protein